MGRKARQQSTSFLFRSALLVAATVQTFFFGLTLTHYSQEPHALPDRVNTPQDELPLNTPQDELPMNTPQYELPLNPPQDELSPITVMKEARDRELKEGQGTNELKEAQGTNERADHAWQWQPQRATAERVNKLKEARNRELKEALDWRVAAAGGHAAAAKPAAGGAKAPNAVTVKCHGHTRRSSVYRYTGGEIREYPSQAVASSWDANWATNIKRIDCSNIPEGPHMSRN